MKRAEKKQGTTTATEKVEKAVKQAIDSKPVKTVEQTVDKLVKAGNPQRQRQQKPWKIPRSRRSGKEAGYKAGNKAGTKSEAKSEAKPETKTKKAQA